MSNASIKGAAVYGKDGNRALHSHDEQWLEHMVHDLYQAVADEPLPKTMLGLVTQLLQKHPSPDAERAHRWRAKADEVRTAAESMDSESVLERPRRDQNVG